MSFNLTSLQLYITTFLLTTLTSFALVPYLKKIAIRFNVVDYPSQSHKTHNNPTPYLGGFAILLPVILLTIVGSILIDYKQGLKSALALIVPMSFLMIVGLIDDYRNISAKIKLFFQFITSVCVGLSLFVAGFVSELTEFVPLNLFLTISWLVVVINAINLIDNFDGSVVGVTFFCSGTIFLLSLANGQQILSLYSLSICGASLGFYYWNRNPARIYLGDSGALPLGLLLAIITLQLEPQTNSKIEALLLPVLLLAYPIIDINLVFIDRIRRGESPMRGGKDHISHRLLARGCSKRRTSLLLWSISGVFSFIVILGMSFAEIWSLAIFSFGILSMLIILFILLRLPTLESNQDFAKD